MPKDARSFFERLAGHTPSYEPEEGYEAVPAGTGIMHRVPIADETTQPMDTNEEESREREEDEGQLSVDVYQTPTHIVIQSTVAGVKPEDLDVSISQDMITIKGTREHRVDVHDRDYYYQELYWGSFSRSILLPQEVDSDSAEASLKNGLLSIKLPKLDKNKTQRLRIKTANGND